MCSIDSDYMLKTSSLGTNTRTEKCHSLIESLTEARPDIATLFQSTNVMNFRPVEPLLHFSPNSVVTCQPGSNIDCWGHRSGEMKAGVSSSRRNADLSRVLGLQELSLVGR